VSTKVSTIIADLPRVNLIPPEIAARKHLRQAQIGMVLVVVAAVAGVAYAHIEGSHNITKAKSRLANAENSATSLQKQIQRYNDVGQVTTELTATHAMLIQATGTEVKWSSYLADLSVVIPQSSWLTGMTISESAAPGTTTNPAESPVQIGQVIMHGNSTDWPTLATYLDSLQPEPGLSDILFSSANEKYIGQHKVVTFTSSADVTSAALCATSPGGC